MRRILHILTRPDDSLAQAMINLQDDAGHEVVCIELHDVDAGTATDADYQVLVEEIFKADSVQVW
ncbi:MAG: hypothetical protein EXS22_01310 [Pedosphaera sp.]|nr:hypothetical protein [Pedosphaera sp.]MSU42663.1 hypothetical protein [Pedosphaera sp.]